MLVHLRLTVPTELTPAVRALVVDEPWITNVTLVEGASIEPAGDLVECDVAREKAGDVLRHLKHSGLFARGGIVVTTPTSTPFEAAQRLEASVPGHPDDAVLWDALEDNAADGAVPTVSFHVFMVLAVALASVAVITDSSILVVGAMVVGPEFSAVAAAAAGIALGRFGLVWRSLRLLVLAFAFAVVVVTVLALFARAGGLVTGVDVTRARPNTGFIWHPDVWSFVVALLAGGAGALALAIDRTNVMVGVFISVTTIPAAGNLALGLALWQSGEILGSVEQLGLNLSGMILAGTVTLVLMRWTWDPVVRYSERLFGSRSDAAPPSAQDRGAAR